MWRYTSSAEAGGLVCFDMFRASLAAGSIGTLLLQKAGVALPAFPQRAVASRSDDFAGGGLPDHQAKAEQSKDSPTATTESARAAAAKDVTNVLGQLRTMRFEREEEQEWVQELQQSLASAEGRASSQDERATSLEAALSSSSAALEQLQLHARDLQQQLLLQRGRSRWLWRKLQPTQGWQQLQQQAALHAELQAVEQQLWQQTKHAAALQCQLDSAMEAMSNLQAAQKHAQAGRAEEQDAKQQQQQQQRTVTLEDAREAARAILLPAEDSGSGGVVERGTEGGTPLDQLQIQIAQRRAAEARAEAAMLVETIEERALEAITSAEEEKQREATKTKQANLRADEARAQAALLVETIEEQAQEAVEQAQLEARRQAAKVTKLQQLLQQQGSSIASENEC
ncbi:hypothetical protein WJX84_011762 [Apatococcus fuscideae]|uniref:Uncharacterized protein n=1 Tax=Apatococcus fuscideae TaxID=2026836 RepID=A0AAW1SZN7_9CHLO